MKQDTRKISELKTHPKQQWLYGDLPDADMVDSVRLMGVMQPIVITHANIIVSGYRRWASATRADLTEVPVVVFESDDELEIQEAMVHFNRQRQKTRPQKARENQLLRNIQTERDKRRQNQLANLNKDKADPESSTEVLPGSTSEGNPAPGKSHDTTKLGRSQTKRAKALGQSTATIDKMDRIDKKRDEAEKRGDTERVAEIDEALEKKSYKKALEVAERVDEPDETAALYRKAESQFGSLRKTIQSIIGGPSGNRLKSMLTDFDNLAARFKNIEIRHTEYFRKLRA